MGLWKPPAKVMVPSQHDDTPSLFEYNGHLPDGTQLLAYLCPDPAGNLSPDESGRLGYRWIGVVHEFDADGHHRLVRTRVINGRAVGVTESVAPGEALLREMVAP